ncbi:hypothetical protein [Herbiconiux sp. UC225_62]|uniref:hypothetical protein n=1 Tax=Herbiconiux sp. UC225_62 TaxID=3350168 RepID=UPI0036D2EAAE
MHMITVVKNGRLNPDVRLWTGMAAVAVAALTLAEFLVQVFLVGARPALDDSAALEEFMTRTANQTLFTILIDTFLMAALIVFLGGFRQIITHTRPDLQWVADLAFGSGLLFIGVTLVGDAMEGGTALDTMGITPDASSLRALTVGHTLMFGSIGCTLTALLAAASGYVTLASGALPPGPGGSPTRSPASICWPCRRCSAARAPTRSSPPGERRTPCWPPSPGWSGWCASASSPSGTAAASMSCRRRCRRRPVRHLWRQDEINSLKADFSGRLTRRATPTP